MYPIRHLIDPPTSNPPPPSGPPQPVVGIIDSNASLFAPPVHPHHSTSAAGQRTGTAPASAPAASPSPASFSQPSSSANANPISQSQQQQPPQPQLPASLYQCAHCLRRYSRPEHLQRHIATHTLGKRFVCDICSKAFARADLLKRHRTNHQDDNSNKRKRLSSAAAGAGRVAHACQACAKARVKCEEMKPCARCKNRGIACEVASSEDAAMHLLHLSANAHTFESQPPDTSPSAASQYPHPSSAVEPEFAQPAFNPVLSSFPSSTRYQQSSLASNSLTPDDRQFKEESQLPTPETLMDQSNPDNLNRPQAIYQNQSLAMMEQDLEKAPFSDFLRDVLYDQSFGNPTRMAEAQGLAVLDFCDDVNLDFREFDFGLLDNWNPDAIPNEPDSTIQVDNTAEVAAMRSTLVKIWTESPWRWVPKRTDTGYNEQSNLPLLSRDAHGSKALKPDRVVKDTLHSSNRDKILAIVLSTCRENSMVNRVASSFPSAEMMDTWIHVFLAAHMCQVSSWIHYGSFSMNQQSPEWLAIATAAGAVLAPVTTLRRFGFALQEAVRVSIPGRFEENNTNIGLIGPVQALMLVQDVGLWSGNRRKMEIAECHLSVPIAMMRYRGKFTKTAYPDVIILPSDEGKALEEKWKKWYQLESWKRLVFHAYLRDAQVSMTQFNNPSMSYAELTLPLPCSKELWFARTADEFKIRYLESRANSEGNNRPPSLGDLFRDIRLLATNHHLLDVQYAISIYLHGFWSLIWEYRQLKSILAPTPTPSPDHNSNPDSLLAQRHGELRRQLSLFQSVTRGWHEMLSAQESMMVLHLLQMNLHVSLIDLQLLTGKEGEDQARRVYPLLQKWCLDSGDSRQALHHAGQIFRWGRDFPKGHLKDFWAIAVHHAALCLWTYGIVVRASGRGRQGQRGGGEVLVLDGEGVEGVGLEEWLVYGGDGGGGGGGREVVVEGVGRGVPVSVEDPRGVMEVARGILEANFMEQQEGGLGRAGGGGEVKEGELPPVSENIVVVLRQLGNAAWAVGFG
ncbi:putative transcription factor [Cercophora samala]|uniref:Transcription factor n=1 Tax=Cercophora samala TaxID=330535 RepID=A0AA39ZAY8_9PEZI|nr:putative transcription factor [Cercophora samala]